MVVPLSSPRASTRAASDALAANILEICQNNTSIKIRKIKHYQQDEKIGAGKKKSNKGRGPRLYLPSVHSFAGGVVGVAVYGGRGVVDVEVYGERRGKV